MDMFSFIVGAVVGGVGLWLLQHSGGSNVTIEVACTDGYAETMIPKGTAFTAPFESTRDVTIPAGKTRSIPLCHLIRHQKAHRSTAPTE